MKKTVFVSILILSSHFCFSETTKIAIESSNPMDIYRIIKFNSEDSESLFPNQKFDSSNLTLVGKTPLDIQVENGIYFYNVGGNNRYSKSFNINATGNDIKVKITGDFVKVRQDSLWALGFGVGCILSLSTVKLIDDQMAADKNYIGFILPITIGCGFCYSFGRWIYDMPRVKVMYE